MTWKRARFRSSASSFLVGTMNVTIAAGFGFISGYYMFKEPLEAYWSAQRQPQIQAEATAATDSLRVGPTSPASGTSSTKTN